jgi:hypothetical protein
MRVPSPRASGERVAPFGFAQGKLRPGEEPHSRDFGFACTGS